MSNCIKDLYDYDLIKKCSKCGNISLKSDFHKNKNRRDGLQPQCKNCILKKQKQYDIENRDKKREYQLKNREQINSRMNLYIKNRIKTDVKFRLIHNTRRRIHHALKGKTKSSSTRHILGIDIETYKKWIEFQFTPEMNWSNIEIDHVKPICLFDVSDDEQLKEAFSWKNTQPLLKHDNRQKGTKFHFLDYQSQFMKACRFIKLNEERFNENIH